MLDINHPVVYVKWNDEELSSGAVPIVLYEIFLEIGSFLVS